jgi:MoaA/NifB/PqqE/SkfB family radical SAM enzyme
MPGLTWLDLTGGEPFLRPDIEDVFARVLEETPRLSVLHFPTNGSFADRAIACARLTRRWRPEVSLLVTVSVDGPPELHDELRGRDGSYQAALEAFEALRRVEGVEAYIGTTVGPDNVDALEGLERSLAEDVREWRPGLWHWNLGQVSSHFFGDGAEDVALPPARAAELVRAQLARRWPPRGAVDLMELGFLAVLPDWIEQGRTGLTCPSLHSTCFVAADARLYPCHVWDRPLVDLREVGFDVARAWASDEVVRARGEVQRLECGDCFTPCEAYPRLAASPVRGPLRVAWRLLVERR